MMASAPPNGLPIFYNDLQPISNSVHGDWKARRVERAPHLAKVHAIPITVDEFVIAQRHYPIIFSSGENSVPLALMGLNEGVNMFVDDDGKLTRETYVPAYVRRYPFMLARLRPDSDDLSLCFDPSSEAIGPFEDGDPLFVDGQPSEATQAILGFCEQFETAGQRTAAFVQDLEKSNLLIDGEFSVQPEGAAQPFIYRGFRMVSEEALRDLRGDQARKFIQNGLLPLIYCHLFSLNVIRDIFALQMNKGLVPQQEIAAV
jgi:hypothetical protein